MRCGHRRSRSACNQYACFDSTISADLFTSRVFHRRCPQRSAESPKYAKDVDDADVQDCLTSIDGVFSAFWSLPSRSLVMGRLILNIVPLPSVLCTWIVP